MLITVIKTVWNIYFYEYQFESFDCIKSYFFIFEKNDSFFWNIERDQLTPEFTFFAEMVSFQIFYSNFISYSIFFIRELEFSRFL